MKRSLIYLSLFCLLLSCKRENLGDCFKGNGKDITVIRNVGGFDTIDVESNLELTIEQGNEFKVEVTAGEHIIKNISTIIKNRQLIIKNNNTCNFVRGYKRKHLVHIVCPEIMRVVNDGVGPIRINNFKQNVIHLKGGSSGDIYLSGVFRDVYSSSHGNGDMHLSGATKNLLVYCNGTNFMRAENMTVTDNIFISTTSLGDAYFDCTGINNFEYYIYSDGNIYHYGDAKKVQRLGGTGGKGELIKLNK